MSDEKQRGVHALNQDFARYDQVTKQQSYHLAEAAEDLYDEDFQIKVCDLSRYLHGDAAEKAAFAAEFGGALEEIGFAVIVGHGLPDNLYSQTRDQVNTVFQRTTRAQRMRFLAQRHGSVKQGYFPMEETSDIHPDQVEGWVFCRRAFNMDNGPDFDTSPFWPDAQTEAVFRPYVQAHEALFKPLMQSMLQHLGCDPHLYDEKLTKTNFGFRLNYYPPIDPSEDAGGPGRILGHEDVDLFTLLAAPDVEGLQVLNRTNNRWVRLNPPPGSIIINTGDYMQRISNDRYPSTTHRVTKPRDRALFSRARISYPIAVYVWEDEILEVLPGLGIPKYEPISAIAFHTHSTAKFYGDDYAVNS